MSADHSRERASEELIRAQAQLVRARAAEIESRPGERLRLLLADVAVTALLTVAAVAGAHGLVGSGAIGSVALAWAFRRRRGRPPVP